MEPADIPRMQTSMTVPVRTLVRGTPLTCVASTSVRDALAAMDRAHVGSIVVIDAAGAPVGILTLPDVLSRVALPGIDTAAAIETVMTRRPVTISGQALAYEAAMILAREPFRHLIVEDAGVVVGVVSEQDLFLLQRVAVGDVAQAIEAAADADAIVAVSADVRAAIGRLMDAGVAAENLMHLTASLNDLLTRRIVSRELDESGRDDVRWCWLALGSEGRFEQTFATDQDNALVFSCPPGREEAIRRMLLTQAAVVNALLDRCGFPLCKGGIMAGNPACCLSLAEWQSRFTRWIDGGSPEELLNASIFFDFRPLAGEAALAGTMRARLLAATAASPRFLHLMAVNALRSTPVLGWFGRIATDGDGEQSGTLDLKLHGVTPFVDGARILSLATGIAETNTCERLRRVAAAGRVRAEEADAWIDAFLFIQVLRLQHQHVAIREGRVPDNRVAPSRLNAVELRVLRAALAQATVLQDRLRLDYRV
jgi:CBS domain-containing protein